MPDGFEVRDKRASRRNNSGIVLGQSVEQAKRIVRNATSDDAAAALSRGRQGPVDADPAVMRTMRMQRRASSATNLSIATGRPKDLMFYWQARNLPYDISKEEELVKLRALCRIIYATHPVIASAIDIFSKYPLLGMEFVCKDKALTDFYTDLFFNQLEYEDYTLDVNREYWTVGEAWPLGSFNEDLGVWEADELINPDDVIVEKSPFLRDPRFSIKLPETLRNVLRNKQPAHEYRQLVAAYPELLKFANDSNAAMPVSNTLLKQMKFKGDTFHRRGIPILLRGLRAVMQEEMLNAAQDAIADRLYTPLILARLGASATDLGTESPWIPNDDDLSAFEDALDTALAADFRVLTHHFAVQMDSVFGRETMPNFDADFDRLLDRQLQVFGMSRTLLMGAGTGETYAADALNRDLMGQLLTTNQRMHRKFITDRMLVVAEAQEHYDYEVRGGKRYPIMEEVLEVDEETGEQKIVQQPKLLVPDIRMKTMNFHDEEVERGFLESLRAGGVPISMETRVVNIGLDLSEEREKVIAEQVDLAVDAQTVRKQTYQRLRAENLPIPEDLLNDFQPKALMDGQPSETPAQQPTREPTLGTDELVSDTALVPGYDEMQSPPGVPTGIPDSAEGPGGQVIQLPTNRIMDSQQAAVPQESNEMRAGMPVASVLVPKEGGEEGEVEEVTGRLIAGPRHVGMRRHAIRSKDNPNGWLDPDAPLGEPEEAVGE